MKTFLRLLILGMVLLVIVGAGTAVSANINGAGYTINKSVIAGGGHQNSTAGGYSLSGTVGQTAVSTTSIQSGNYQLHSGFWAHNGTNPNHYIYLPMIVR